MNLDIKRRHYTNGKIMEEEHFLNGRRHREDGSAWTWYYEDGMLERERFLFKWSYSQRRWSCMDMV
jgi:antitoxin component YwqK of YwqJK toxin-antitoxin module